MSYVDCENSCGEGDKLDVRDVSDAPEVGIGQDEGCCVGEEVVGRVVVVPVEHPGSGQRVPVL